MAAKLRLYKFQKEMAKNIADTIWCGRLLVLQIPTGYGKAMIMQEVARLLKNKGKTHHARKNPKHKTL